MSKLKKREKNKNVKLTNNAVIYIRVSTEEQAKKGYSLDAQEEQCQKFALMEELNVLKVFREEGQSAKTTNRTEFKKMMKYCKENKNKISYIIVWKIERFSRSLSDLLTCTNECNNLGITLLSATEPNEKGAAGNLNRNFLGALAQYDNELKSERVTNGMQKAFRSGRWLWRAPYGYEQNQEINNIQPKAGEKEIVKKIFEKFATGCYSQANILEDLKKEDVKLRPNHLCEILRNPIYCGIMYKEEWAPEPIVGTFEPIISEKIFNTAQDILNGRKPVIAPHDFCNPDYPLKQFLLCPYCGRRLTGSTSTGRNKKKFYYYSCYNKECPSKFSMSRDVVEKEFVEVLKQIKPKSALIDIFKLMIKDVYNQLTCERRIQNSRLQKDLKNLEEKKKRLVDLFLEGKIDEDTYGLKLDEFKQSEKSFKANMQDTLLTRSDFEKCLNSSLSIIQNLEKAWINAAYDIKKNLQNLIFPNGLSADFSNFQNRVNPSIFKQIGTLSVPSIDMVLPGEFESPSTP